MRMNANNYRSILSKSGLNDTEVCKRTGLSEKTLFWILDNGFIEISTLERIADALGCSVGEIALEDIGSSTENVIEWQRDAQTATLSISQRGTISRIKKLAEKHPEKCQIIAENTDGSIYAHIPVKWIKIHAERDLTDEQRKVIAEQLHKNILNSSKYRENLGQI